MAKGGARARSGPAPDPLALRRERDGGDWVSLSEGRDGPVPAWPLTDPSERESALWESEWVRPQAVMWERNGLELEVALYVRAVAIAEDVEAPTNARTLVRQLREDLGLSLTGLHRHKWRLDSPTETRATGKAKTPARSRFSVVEGGKRGVA